MSNDDDLWCETHDSPIRECDHGRQTMPRLHDSVLLHEAMEKAHFSNQPSLKGLSLPAPSPDEVLSAMTDLQDENGAPTPEQLAEHFNTTIEQIIEVMDQVMKSLMSDITRWNKQLNAFGVKPNRADRRGNNKPRMGRPRYR